MKTNIQESLSKSYTYIEYRQAVANLLAEGKSSGNEQSEALFHYSELNETRMKRLDKTMKIADDVSQKLLSIDKEYIWLVLAEGWCGDAAQLLPVFEKMVAVTSKIEFKIVFRDENENLMNQFLTNGAKAIPKLIILEKASLNVEGIWGPRPTGAADLIKNYKAKFGIVDEKAKIALQLWYLHDKGVSTQEELIELMMRLN